MDHYFLNKSYLRKTRHPPRNDLYNCYQNHFPLSLFFQKTPLTTGGFEQHDFENCLFLEYQKYTRDIWGIKKLEVIQHPMDCFLQGYRDRYNIIEKPSGWHFLLVKFMFSKKATKNDEIFTVNLTVTRYCIFLWPS